MAGIVPDITCISSILGGQKCEATGESDDVPDLAWNKVSVSSRYWLFLISLILTIKRCD
jgi:hypothetical protein